MQAHELRRESNEKGVSEMAEVKLVVFMEGGLVQEILSNVATEVLILDEDVEGCDADDIRRAREWDFEKKAPSGDVTFRVYDRKPWDVDVFPNVVEHYFNEMAEEREVFPDAGD